MNSCIYRIFKQQGVKSDGRDEMTRYFIIGPDHHKYFNLVSIEGVIAALKEEISKNVSKSDPELLETTMELSFHPAIDITIFLDHRCVFAQPLKDSEIERIWLAITNYIEEIRRNKSSQDKE